MDSAIMQSVTRSLEYVQYSIRKRIVYKNMNTPSCSIVVFLCMYARLTERLCNSFDTYKL